MLRLIVNADDMGLTERVNEGILQAHQTGIVTSTSIMANGSAFEDAVTRCKKVPTLDVGVHLTLVEERPCLKPPFIPSLVEPTGTLHHDVSIFAKKYFAGKIRLEEVWRELEAQVVKVLSRGLSVSHLDSHQHIHMLPQVLNITVKLARKYNIPAIRLSREPIRKYMLNRGGGVPRVLQLMILNFFGSLGQKRIELRADRVAGFHIAGNLNKKNLQKLLQSLPDDGICELMCHPGLDDPNSRYSHWRYRWQDELNALADPEIDKYFHLKSIRRVTYRELANSKSPRERSF